MRIINMTSALILSALCLGAVASPAAADAARDAIMHKCIIQAQERVPGGAGDNNLNQQRTYAYKACMTENGQLP